MNNEFENLQNIPPEDMEDNSTEVFSETEFAPETQPKAQEVTSPESESDVPENSFHEEAKAFEETPAVISAPEKVSAPEELRTPEESFAPSESPAPAAFTFEEEKAHANQEYVPREIPSGNSAVGYNAPTTPTNPVPPYTHNYPQGVYNYQRPVYHPQNQTPPYAPYGTPNTPPYQMPPVFYPAPPVQKHSKGSKALVIILWILVALFAIGFFVMCGYVISNYPEATKEETTAPTLFKEDTDKDTPSTAPKEEETEPQSDIVEGGVIPNDDKSDYSSDSSIILVNPPKDKDDNSKYTTQYAYNQISDSAVGIVCYTGKVTDDSEPASQGTGIVITKDGYIATNSHVIGDSRNLYKVRVVLNDGTTFEAKIIGYDTRTDLAVLKVSAKDLKPAVFCDSDKTEIGDDVIAIGNPGGMDFQNSLTKGIISAKDRELSLSAQVSYIQTDAAINPGNSGGPLCNMYGQVIGINTAKISDSSYEGMGFAIPSQTAKKVIDDLIHQGYVGGRVRIGISGQAVTEAMKQYYALPAGILIGEITEDGPCDGSGLKTNDVMTAIDGEKVETFKDVYAILEKHSAGDKVTLSIYRSDTDEELEIEITLQADEGQTQQ